MFHPWHFLVCHAAGMHSIFPNTISMHWLSACLGTWRRTFQALQLFLWRQRKYPKYTRPPYLAVRFRDTGNSMIGSKFRVQTILEDSFWRAFHLFAHLETNMFQRNTRHITGYYNKSIPHCFIPCTICTAPNMYKNPILLFTSLFQLPKAVAEQVLKYQKRVLWLNLLQQNYKSHFQIVWFENTGGYLFKTWEERRAQWSASNKDRSQTFKLFDKIMLNTQWPQEPQILKEKLLMVLTRWIWGHLWGWGNTHT